MYWSEIENIVNRYKQEDPQIKVTSPIDQIKTAALLVLLEESALLIEKKDDIDHKTTIDLIVCQLNHIIARKCS